MLQSKYLGEHSGKDKGILHTCMNNVILIQTLHHFHENLNSTPPIFKTQNP